MTSGSGFLYAAIVGMWALVLIPMWLRRHDAANESRNADRFAKAMVTLRRSGRENAGSVPSGREVLMPGRTRSSRTTQVTVTGPAAERTPAAVAAARRRRVLLVLMSLLTVTLVLVALKRLPLLTSVVPLLLVVGFLVVARQQVRVAAEMRRRRDRRATLSEAARAATAEHSGTSAARRGGRVVDPAPATERIVAADPLAATGTDDSWHAVPTTLPTYVTAPRATRMPRVIDLTHPGAWTGAAMVEQARSTLSAEPVADGEMRVETFEIAVPRDGAVPETAPVAAPSRSAASYADRYVEDDDMFESLDADDLDALVEDPRTGAALPTWRRAANG